METRALCATELGCAEVPPSGGSLEIGNTPSTIADGGIVQCSPFGGIPRNWKLVVNAVITTDEAPVPPSGGSLEIGNVVDADWRLTMLDMTVPPSGGSLEIGNYATQEQSHTGHRKFPLRGDP